MLTPTPFLSNMLTPTSFQNSNVKPKLKLELYYRDHAVLDVHHYHALVKELQRDGFQSLKLIRTLDWETRREIVAGGKERDD